MSGYQEGTSRLNELSDKLHPIVRQDMRLYTVRYNPIIHKMIRNLRRHHPPSRYGSCYLRIPILHSRDKLVAN